MTFRTILLAGSVLALASGASAPAFAQSSAGVQVAQADACAGDAACQAKQDKKKKRQERRQNADQAGQAAGAADAGDQGGGGDEKKKKRDQAQQQDQPAATSGANNNADQNGGDRKRKKDKAQAGDQPTNPPAAATTSTDAGASTDQNAAGDRKKRADRVKQGGDQGENPPAAAVDDTQTGDTNANATTDRKTKRDGKGNAQAGSQDAKTGDAADAATADKVAEPGQDTQDSRADRKKKRDARRKAREEQATQDDTSKKVDPKASPVEQQLQSQGSDAQARKIRDLRMKLREARRENRPDEQVVERRGDRDIIRRGDQIYVVPADTGENERLLYGASDVQVQQLPNGLTQTTVFRADGTRIITTRDADGSILNRTRRTPDGRDFVLINDQYRDRPPAPVIFEQQLPPVVVTIPREQYIVDTQGASQDDIEQALSAPPVERVERAYTLDEVRRSERLREKVRRVDLDTITFESGSAVVGSDQLDALDQVGTALEEVVAKNPQAVFLIEGHTDAVGSDEDNLVLSDQRAEAVATALAQDYNIPPENLITQGYGEQYLKVPVQGDERENRRVTLRNISQLLSASK